MLKRKIEDKLLKWRLSSKKKALCITGARQIGKTTAVREFANKYYDVFVEINFIFEKDAYKIFDGNLDANSIISNISAYKKIKLIENNTLILFDEIQECPNARVAIKSLVEDGRFDYIETGSLLGVNYKNVSSYPVGFEEIVHMYPMDFEEFLIANNVNEETINDLKFNLDNYSPISESTHNVMKKLFNVYVVVGGMPEIVQEYVNSHDIAKVIERQKNILDLYRMDISKYASKTDKLKIQAIYDSIPSELNKKNRRFFINSLNDNARLNRYENSFLWLKDAGVALPCYNVDEPKLPLELNAKRSLFKLFMSDTGLLCASSMDNIQFDILQGDLSINMGSVLENAIATQLKANGFDLYYFDSKKYGELDFVIKNGMNINLIEAKSGNDYNNHQALNNVLNVNEWIFDKTYVLCGGNIERVNDIVYLPYYLTMFIKPKSVIKDLKYEVDTSSLQ